MESTRFCLELRKRKEKAYLEFTPEELKENPEKILNILKKEFIHLKSWFIVIVIILIFNKCLQQKNLNYQKELTSLRFSNTQYYKYLNGYT